ncbi:hypothetical protein JXA56_05015, partial [Candidatus Micrarchaeota archaeon]|nr:hypothetical protein [Candidatus Micrarchaeota archaeon]
MGGLRLQLQPIVQPKFYKPLLVKATVTLNGRKFSTHINEGATADELILKIAKENRGGVAKVYYPEFNSHEIVAVKIGDQLLVKGDPKRVAEADFSNFENSGFVRSAAIAASRNSDGGIHFFVGSQGIPMAVDKSQNLLFPNAEELRVGKHITDLSLRSVPYNADPEKISDLDRMYKGGTKISPAARKMMKLGREEFEKSHGGFRSEKLMLADTSVLIMERDTGELKCANEQKTNEIVIPLPPEIKLQQIFTPAIANTGFILPTDLGPMIIPMDGSAVKVPYLYIRKFDARARDYIEIKTDQVAESEASQKPDASKCQKAKMAKNSKQQKEQEVSEPKQEKSLDDVIEKKLSHAGSSNKKSKNSIVERLKTSFSENDKKTDSETKKPMPEAKKPSEGK